MPDGRSRLPAHQASSSDSARNTAAKPSSRRLGGVSISGIERDGNWAVIGPAWIIRKNGPLLSILPSPQGSRMAGAAVSGRRGALRQQQEIGRAHVELQSLMRNSYAV